MKTILALGFYGIAMAAAAIEPEPPSKELEPRFGLIVGGMTLLGLFGAGLGSIGTILGVASFATSFPKPDSDKRIWTNVRIQVAVNDHEGMDADGDAPDVYMWNEVGDFLGHRVDPGTISNGGFNDIKVQAQETNAQATYALLVGNNNAICIAHAEIQWPDGNEYGWVGNWARTCGKPWSVFQ